MTKSEDKATRVSNIYFQVAPEEVKRQIRSECGLGNANPLVSAIQGKSKNITKTPSITRKPSMMFKIFKRRISSSDVLVQRSAEIVLEPLKDGICSLNKVYESLIDANYSSTRQQIVEAQQSLERSEQAASAGLKSLDENIEKLTEEEGKLEQEKKDTIGTLENLRTEKKTNKKILKHSKDDLEQARTNLSSTQETLQNQETRRQNGVIITSVGAGLFLIPIIGWIAGAGMVIGGAIEIDQANKAIETAQEEVKKSESQVEMYEQKTAEYKSKISQTRHDISKKQDKLKETKKEILGVKKKREALVNFQEKVRRAVHVVGILNGRSNVVEHQTRKIILQEPVMKVMEEVIKATVEIAGNQLLYTKHIAKLIKVMRKNNQKLAAICASNSKDEDENFY